MTTLLAPAGATHVAPDPVPCPTWCAGAADWHPTEDGDICHDSEFVVVATGTGPCTRHGGECRDSADEVWLSLERNDTDGVVGEAQLSLSLHTDEAHLTLDRAEELARRILALVAAARGAKRARDVEPGDVIVWNGVEHTAVVVLADGGCCDRQCGGSVCVETDLSGEGNFVTGAETFDPDDLVPVRPKGVGR